MSLKSIGKHLVKLGSQLAARLGSGQLPLRSVRLALKASRTPAPKHIFSRNSFYRLNIFISNPRYNHSLLGVTYPDNLDSYDIGDYIAHGCNAAVYQLRLSQSNMIHKPFDDDDQSYPLALKVMFNFDYSLPERYIWKDMGTELIPLKSIPEPALVGRMANFRSLRRKHPNLVQMHTAFVDRMPHLEEAELLFTEVTPSYENFGLIVEPKTLFVVMKRYRMTLREYTLRNEVSQRNGQVMFGQLAEALVFLEENKISHRDMKSDNILLDYDTEDEIPHLVLSDFGSALVNGFKLVYKDEFTDLGGNMALRAPEISRVRVEPGVVLDYSKADLWAAGTIAYEMFGAENPFYSRYSSRSYDPDNLPPFPEKVPTPLDTLIRQVLKLAPSGRPKVSVVANTVTLSLFGHLKSLGHELSMLKTEAGHWVNGFLSDMHDAKMVMADLVGLFAAETFVGREGPFSAAELQLRASFFARLHLDDVRDSLRFFANASPAGRLLAN